MPFLRNLSLLALLLTGCRERVLATTDGELIAQPARVDFGQVWVGHRATQQVELRNTAPHALEVTVRVAAPFEAPTRLTLAGGASQRLDVSLVAAAPGAHLATLELTWGENTRELTLEARAVTPPSCPARDCHRLDFDPVSGTCTDSLEPDGAHCGALNQCLVDGVCMGGECLGRARDCGDGDTCTTDACDPATGCVHEAVACAASTNPCEVPVCDARTGCGLTPALDGVACGSNDCVTAHVCIAGQCVTRAAPDGSECAAPTVCRGTGLCRAQACEVPAPTVLSPRWRYTPEADHTVSYLGHVDELGNLYATESWVGPQQLVSPQPGAAEDRTGAPFQPPPDGPIAAVLSLTPTGVVRFRVPAVFGCSGCVWGLSFAVDSAAHRLFFVSMGELHAHSTDDGRLLWSTNVTSGLPAVDVRSDGGAVFSLSPPMLLGDDEVGVPVLEGNSDHHSYVQVFDRVTGATRWQFHRKGHLYAPGVTTNGELWTSSANCWAVAGEMARVDEQGRELGTHFVQWLPSSYGDGFALGSANGAPHLLDSSFALTDLSPLAPVSGAAQPLISGQQVVLWDAPARAVHSIDLVGHAETFRFDGVLGAGPEFELLRDGGVAWTAQAPDGGVLGAIDGRGRELVQCPLATPVDSTTTIVRGRAYLESAGSIVSFDVPGLDVEPHGWVAKQGSLQRGQRAR